MDQPGSGQREKKGSKIDSLAGVLLPGGLRFFLLAGFLTLFGFLLRAGFRWLFLLGRDLFT